jgi:hypothetical protein
MYQPKRFPATGNSSKTVYLCEICEKTTAPGAAQTGGFAQL